MKKALIIIGAVLGVGLLVLLMLGGWVVGHYNGIQKKDQGVQSAWSQVENVYQRRYDLIPNLVETVKGVASFEKDTFTAVAQARASVGQMKIDASSISDPAQLEKFASAQQTLGTAISRLMMVQERYPELKANANFTALQAQLEGTENRISVERKNFNDAVLVFNTHIKTFPGNIFAGFFNFKEKPFFKMEEGAKTAPKVNFGSAPAAPPAPRVVQ